MSSLNTLGQRFADSLHAASLKAATVVLQEEHENKIHVSGAGRTLTQAYEQLRNAAEYTEEHLLLQRAIHRFYRRTFLPKDETLAGSSGEELVIELTLAGYLQNDTVAAGVVPKINKLARDYFLAQTKYGKDAWGIDVLAVEIEQLLNYDIKRDIFVQFAYDYFLQAIDREKLLGGSDPNYELALFVAVHRSLLKSDPATIRSAMLGRYKQEPLSASYGKTNEMLDGILDSPAVDKAQRFISKHGAALRILSRLIDEEDDVSVLLQSREQFLVAFEKQIIDEYTRIDSRINRGILKSVIFLIITKFIIGIAIEVPYDYWAHGEILWLALAVNLLFPPIYMVLLRFTLTLPGTNNTTALTDTIDSLLYGKEQTTRFSYGTSSGFGTAFNIAYGLLFIVIFGSASYGLVQLGFSALHLLIFFIFLSTASFLGFRLSRQIREIEAGDSQQNGISMIRDFLYIPFVVVGRWMSEKYARVNIVAMTLDMVIELPLKTVLHLLRQWGSFIASKKDEL